MFERVLTLHDRAVRCRSLLDSIIQTAALCQQPHFAPAQNASHALAMQELPGKIFGVRTHRRGWQSASPVVQNRFPAQGHHKQVIEIADLLQQSVPAQPIFDAARVFGFTNPQSISVLNSFTAACGNSNLTLPQMNDLTAELHSIQDGFFNDSLANCTQCRTTAIAAATAALAAAPNNALMSQAELAKTQFYGHVYDAMSLAQTPMQRNAVELLLTQGYGPLDQING